ncbi:Crp/Fnr family transcriptional regulator [uncultured Arcticibacterium sp.]|mgnify:CR=1 FL=1|uniref:Crp/Fnr family transcriptional regulator n=1 Tax=uncultured Arcticibacterium sp. TaxID=2173042 RepID=UPI0030FB65E4
MKVKKDSYFKTMFAYIDSINTLPESDKQIIRESFEPCFMKKDSFISSAGKVPLYHNFIVSGYVRNYHINDKGEEVTTDLNDSARYFTSYNHFMNRTVSHENICCITDCEILRIERNMVDVTAEIGHTQKDFTMKILQKILAEEKERMTDMATLTADERYLKLMKEKPNIVQNVPLKYIASYLGIKAESLSRIRRDVLLNKC